MWQKKLCTYVFCLVLLRCWTQGSSRDDIRGIPRYFIIFVYYEFTSKFLVVLATSLSRVQLYTIGSTICLAVSDKCLAEAQTGLCRASIRRYHYNNGICQPFIYGGCGGNQNNYETEETCMTTCTGTVVCDYSFPDQLQSL